MQRLGCLVSSLRLRVPPAVCQGGCPCRRQGSSSGGRSCGVVGRTVVWNGVALCVLCLSSPPPVCASNFTLTLPFQGTWLALDGPARAGTWPGLRRARQGDGARGWSITPGEGRRCRQTPSPADGRAQVGVSRTGPPAYTRCLVGKTSGSEVHVKSKKPILAVWWVRLPAAR